MVAGKAAHGLVTALGMETCPQSYPMQGVFLAIQPFASPGGAVQ